jgi:hypothetical protein
LKKAVFKKKWFYWVVVIFFSILLCFNIFELIKFQRIKAIIPCLIISGVLCLIFTKNRFSKILIQLFSVLFSIALFVEFLAFIKEGDNSSVRFLFSCAFFAMFICMSLFILIMAPRTIKIEEPDASLLKRNLN